MSIGSFAVGSPVIGGALSKSPTSTISIDGDDKTWLCKPGSMNIQIKLKNRGKAKVKLIDTRAAPEQPLTGQLLEIKNDGTRLFRGTIEKVKRTFDKSDNSMTTLDVEAVDFSQYADRFLVAARYEDQTVDAIVKDIVNNQTPMATEGVTVTGVEPGPVVSVANFNYDTVTKCLDDLSKMIDWQWFIDCDKNLKFFDGATFIAPTGFGDTQEDFMSFSETIDRSRYYNELIFRGRKGRFDNAKTRQFKGNDEDSVFSLEFEVAEKPLIQVNNDPFVDPAKIGIRNQDDEDQQTSPPAYDFEWFYAPEEKEISQNINATPLTSTDVLKVTYIGLFPILVQAENLDEQASRKAVEGGSGIYQKRDSEDNIDGVDNAAEFADGLLGEHDQIPQTLAIRTRLKGFTPGQIIPIDFASLGIQGTYIIDRVRYSEDRGSAMPLITTVNMIDAGRVVHQADFWRRLAEQGQVFEVRENEKLIFFRKGNETMAFTDSILMETGDQLAAFESDEYSVMLMGIGVIGRSKIGLPFGVS